ncbi:uncharacterized protein JCM6883_005534 [Sporobolomyces salmoneus]|uniref:uncharacterized protein n=1 Tax=Sporobolomyces salmoneus TaxID=183962 RepID=UPI00317D955C
MEIQGSDALLARNFELSCIASSSAPNSSLKDSGAFFRDARICPDGSRVLASADDRSLSLIPLPEIGSNSSSSPSPSISTLSPRWKHEPSDSLLSYDWYPGASSTDPSMFAFALGVKDHPVHLLDGNDRRIRASYPIIDHTERFVAPTSMRFSPDGTSLYCGFENAIEIFDVSRPGEEGFRLKTTPNRSSRTGQKGLISTLDFSPSQGLVGAGSFTGTIGLYDACSPSPLVGLLPSTQRGGIIKVLFHPTIPHLLFAASRQSSYLEVFDLRNFALEPIKLERRGRTNQRLGFDIDSSGNWLMTGDQNGSLSFFDTSFLAYSDTSTPRAPTRTHSISSHPVGACFFHPLFPSTQQIITCSGTRKFPLRSKRRRRDRSTSDRSDSEESSDDETEIEDAEGDGMDAEEGKDSLQVFKIS